MEKTTPAIEFLAQLVVRASDSLRRFARSYRAILFTPGDSIPLAAAGTEWSFPLTLIIVFALLKALLLRIAWPAAAKGIGLGTALAAGQINIGAVFLSAVVFWLVLSVVTLLGVRVFGRQHADLQGGMNCVAVAMVPLSALTVVGWIVLYLSPALALVVVVFGLMASLCFYAEALRTQYNLPVGVSLYAIPLMVAVALLITGLLVLACEAMTRGQAGGAG